MLAAGSGLGVVYLGADLPAAEIAAAAGRASARVVVVGVMGAAGVDEPLAGLDRLVAALPAPIEVWVGGGASEEVEREVRRRGIRYFENLGAYEQAIAGLGAGR